MARIVCIGVAALDHIYKIDTMPTRAEKYRARDFALVGGGTAATAAAAAARLGAEVRFLTTLGDDATGDDIVAGLEREGIDCSGVVRVAGRRSPISTILVDAAGERMVVAYADPAMAWEVEPLPRHLPPGTTAVLGDAIWPAGSAHVFRLARAAGIPAVLDGDRASRDMPAVLDLATHVAFSLQGARDFTGEADPAAAIRALREHTAGWLAVTDGANGVFFEENGVVAHEPAFPIEAVDTLGAGDTWHGAFTVALAEGQSERAAIRFASAAAALKCTRFGGRAGAPRRTEVEAFLRKAVPGPA